MKFTLLLSVLTCAALDCVSQDINIADDTITYNKKKFFPGREVQIFFGSGKNGDFVYAFIAGKSRIIKDFRKSDLYPMSSHFAKAKMKIDKVYYLAGKYFAKGVLVHKPNETSLSEYEVFLDVKGVMDHNEIWED